MLAGRRVSGREPSARRTISDSQKFQYEGTTTILASMPDRLRAEVANHRMQRLYLYDGKIFTLFAKRANFYATEPAPAHARAKLDDMLEREVRRRECRSPISSAGASPNCSAERITAATDIGPRTVGGDDLRALRLPPGRASTGRSGSRRGDYPLPRKLVITTTTDEARPQHHGRSTPGTWRPCSTIRHSRSPPPAGVGKVLLAEAQAAAGAAK